MADLDVPIFKKSYDLYRVMYGYRMDVPKQDRYVLWQRCEECMLDIIEQILIASQSGKTEKLMTLEKVSVCLNLLRVLIRLAKDVKAVDNSKYMTVEASVDEIGRMLGGWIKSTKER